jgi:hypothetical protein
MQTCPSFQLHSVVLKAIKRFFFIVPKIGKFHYDFSRKWRVNWKGLVA